MLSEMEMTAVARSSFGAVTVSTGATQSPQCQTSFASHEVRYKKGDYQFTHLCKQPGVES